MDKLQDDELYQCYNKGCGSKFKLKENTEGSCCYHPGAPVFHDAYKGWSCCNKKSTDFTTFLHMPGCAKGEHNPVKPSEPEKQKCEPMRKDEVITVRPPKQENMKRPSCSSKFERINPSVSQSLKEALSKVNKICQDENEEKKSTSVSIGESCKNNGCGRTFEGEYSNLELCKYHPGIPIFHEGMKYWSCCQRKTSDFESFLQQEGCSSGTHLWIKKNFTKASCRYDWHQTPTHVFITVYAKLSNPDFCSFEVNPVRMKINVSFGESQEFNLDEELGGIIVSGESNVLMAATKVEIKLRKAEPSHWREIFLPKTKSQTSKTESLEDKTDQGKELSVDAIDLNDI